MPFVPDATPGFVPDDATPGFVPDKRPLVEYPPEISKARAVMEALGTDLPGVGPIAEKIRSAPGQVASQVSEAIASSGHPEAAVAWGVAAGLPLQAIETVAPIPKTVGEAALMGLMYPVAKGASALAKRFGLFQGAKTAATVATEATPTAPAAPAPVAPPATPPGTILIKGEVVDPDRVVDIALEAEKMGMRPETAMTSAERELFNLAGDRMLLHRKMGWRAGSALGPKEAEAFAPPVETAPPVRVPLAEVPVATTPAIPTAPLTAVARMGQAVDSAEKTVLSAADRIAGISRQAELAMKYSDDIAKTGTIPEDVREAYRAGGLPAAEADIRAHMVSADTINEASSNLILASNEVRKMERAVMAEGDVLSANTATIMRSNIDNARKQLERAAQMWKLKRFTANRVLHQFNEATKILREQQVLIDGLKQVKEKMPITENIIHSLRNWGSLRPGDKQQFWRDVVNQVRLNLFAPFSFSLDLISNISEGLASAPAAIGHDIAYVARHGPSSSLPAVSGWIRSLVGVKGGRLDVGGFSASKAIDEGLGFTVGGELVGGGLTGDKGTFFTRTNPLTALADYFQGIPLYAKGVFDTAAKRIGAMSYLYREGNIAADAAKISGGARRDFIERFVASPPPDVLEEAISRGKAAGFSRELSPLEERISASPFVQLVGSAFPRWGFQFTRWAGEMLGMNPKVIKNILSGKARSEDVGEWLGRSATGWGGLLLLDSLYNQVDFNSMEYVREDGERVRLSNREPITTGLWLLAVAHGDKDKAAAGLRHTSLPGAQVLAGQGGMLTSVLDVARQMSKQRNISPRRMMDEVTDSLNRAIPGQALLGLLKTIHDPVLRKGVGAGIPIYSKTLPAVISPTTGRPMEPRQRIPGIDMEVPSVLGTPIPGATRVMDPMQKMLSKYGVQVYRGPRSSISGIPEYDLPEQYKDEWMSELAKGRALVFKRFIEEPAILSELPRSQAIGIVKSMDSQAAAMASQIISAKYGLRPAEKQPTSRELAMPNAFRKSPSPGATKTAIVDEMLRLNLKVEAPSKMLGNVELNDEQYRYYSEMSGSIAEASMTSMMNSPAYPKMKSAKKLELARKAIADARRDARYMLMARFPEIPAPR